MSNAATAYFTGTTAAVAGTNVIGNIAPNAAYIGGASGNFNELISRYESVLIRINSGGATGGLTDWFFQVSPDEGTTWMDIGHIQYAAAAAANVQAVTVSRYQSTVTPVVTGDGVLAVGPFINGEFTNRLRIKVVSGAGTSAGAAYTVQMFFNTIASG